MARPTPSPAPAFPAISTRARAWLIAFTLLGLVVSAAAAWVHYRLLHVPGYTSFCDFNTTWSCSEVYLSRYGSVWGVPVAVGGTLWFVLVLLLLGGSWAGPVEFRQNVSSYVFVLATLGLAVVLYLGYTSFFRLHALCILCLTTYVAVIGVFFVSGATPTLPMKMLPRRFVLDLRALASRPLSLVLALAYVAAAVAAVFFVPWEATMTAAPPVAVQQAQAPAAQAPKTATDQQTEFERWYAAQPRANLPVPSEGAKVLIVKFSDYQCPACAQSYEWYRPILAKYETTQPGKVRFVTLDFPLNHACNGAMTRDLHLASCEAAVAVRLAREHNRGDAMERWLYANQATLTPEIVRAAARDVGGVQDFDARYTGVLQAVKTDAALGGLNNVHSTPTFFINGTMLVGALPPQFFDAAIAFELKRSGQ